MRLRQSMFDDQKSVMMFVVVVVVVVVAETPTHMSVQHLHV